MKIRRANFSTSLIVLLSMPLPGCITLIAPYDQKVDEMTTTIQRKVSEHIEELDGASAPDCFYPNHKKFYDEARVEVSALDVRARSLDLNVETQAQTAELGSMINSFQRLHELDTNKQECLSSAELTPVKRAFDSATGAILKLEIAKKRGK